MFRRKTWTKIAASLLVLTLTAWTQAPLCSAATSHAMCKSAAHDASTAESTQTSPEAMHVSHTMQHSPQGEAPSAPLTAHSCCPGKTPKESCSPRQRPQPQSCAEDRDCCAKSNDKQAAVNLQCSNVERFVALVAITTPKTPLHSLGHLQVPPADVGFVKPVSERKTDLRI
jgi:hypothetical protein